MYKLSILSSILKKKHLAIILQNGKMNPTCLLQIPFTP